MENKLEKRYGLFTAICMVVGIVIGSGVFFKAQDILNYTDGNMMLGILAWVIGGVVMIVCAFTIANLATKYEKINGIVDYAEATVGEKYAYMFGWFMTVIYYPSMTSVLAWVSARYTVLLFNPQADTTGGLCIALAAFYLCVSFAVNVLAPKIAGKFQVSATVIKLIPLLIMIVAGTIAGISNGNTSAAFESAVALGESNSISVFSGIAAAAFAYEGWIIATSINSELKNAKRNLPIALMVGTFIIMLVYILYFIGLSGGADVSVLRHEGSTTAFKNLFGGGVGTVLNVFVAVSCLGTLNGLMLACTRGMYSIAARKQGPCPEIFSEVNGHTKMPTTSGVMGLLICVVWFFYFYGANLAKESIFGIFSFDSSELPIITIYGMYIPIFVMFIKKEGKKNILKNIVMPTLAIIASLFMIFTAFFAHGIVAFEKAAQSGQFAFPVLFYLIVYVAIMLFGLIFYKKK